MEEVVIDQEEKDDELCDVCRDGEVYEGNEILFCDKCNVAVHQSCYGVKRIPTGNWFCDVCKANNNPLETKCELCKFTGGAYKQTDKGQWVHQLCANWQPEVFVVEKGGHAYVSISGLEKARLRLKCALCNSSGGASVQCSYGRCVVAVHPWCCLHDPKGFSKRIVKTPDGDNLWEIFCKNHASAVLDPVKPHSKKVSRPQVRQSIEVSHDVEKSESTVSVEKVTRDRSRDTIPKSMILSMDHAISFQRKAEASSLKKTMTQSVPSTKVTNGRAVNRTFPIRTMSEWPGQSEGEGMDLDHFWNVISMYHPEDHPADWLEFMKSGVVNNLIAPVDLCMPCLGSTDNYKNISAEEEELLFEGITEKQKENLYDYEHRSKFRTITEKIVSNITCSSLDAAVISREDSTITDQLIEKESDYQASNCFLDDNEFFVKEKFATVTSESTESLKDGTATISAVFDGEKRASCEFRVKLVSSTENNKNSVDSLKCTDEHNKWVKSFVFQPEHQISSVAEDEIRAIVELSKVEEFPDDKPVFLADKIIIPNDENDEVSRAIRADQESLLKLTAVIEKKLISFDALNLNEISGKEAEKHLEWDLINTKYESQLAWKKMATCMSNGMKDQTPDFNQTVSERLPASWQIQVDGRPTAEQVVEQEQQNENHEDAVCMVCFDGSSKDGNPILFCDGCNAALHQACYGIAEIPEGDFFCERCKHVLVMTEDYESKPPPFQILEMVKCCLCPQYHGGIKPTVDGHWVHMCCTLWAKNSIIKDLKVMSPVDLSDVDCDVTDECIYCNLHGGYLQYCDCAEDNCLNTFHPICAWFAGAKFVSTVTDVTFAGIFRHGLYPSGVEVKIYCEKHDIDGEEGRKAQQEQIRKKYSHKIEDQCHLPGRRVTNTSTQRKNKKREAAAAVTQSRVTSTINKNQELKVDVYDLKNCAMCSEPFDKATLHYETDDKIVCHSCSIYVHLKCLKDVSPDFEEGSSKFWTCDKCMSFPPEPAPAEGTWPICEFCPRRGGAYKPMTNERWAHVFCASNCNGKKVVLPTGELDVKLSGKVDKKHKCTLCNRKEGFLKCFNDACSAYFHPLCAGRSARTYIKSTRDGMMVWCTDHLPVWLHRTMQGVWINCADIEFLRWTLTNAQGLSNLVDTRIKLKRHEAKTSGDLFSARFNQLLENAKGRESIDINEENQWIFDNEGIYEGPEDEQAIAAAALKLKREAPVILPGEQVDVEMSWGEMVTISANWTVGKTVHVPRKVIVQNAGIDFIKKNTTVDVTEFKDRIKNEFRRKFSHDKETQYQFKEIEVLHEKLAEHLTKYCKMPSALFISEMAKQEIVVDENMFPSKRKLKKDQQKEAPASKKRKETVKGTPQIEKKDKHDYKYIEQKELITILEGAPTLRNFCFSYVDSKPSFDHTIDMVDISQNPGFSADIDEWKLCNDDDLPNLERRLLDIINQILDYKVPLNGETNSNNNNNSKKKSKKGAEDMRELAADFTEIDFSDFQDYHYHVRRLLDLTYVKDKLTRHEYFSMADFTKDFYELINNARCYTNEASLAWKDAEELGKIFNGFKKTSITNPNGYRNDRPTIKAIKIFGRQASSSSSSSSETRITACGVCNENFMIQNWPDKAWPMELEKREGRVKTVWHWKCPSCIATAGTNNSFWGKKTRVKIWWLDDAQYYYGFINAYDDVSKRYRVLYDDSEWEFINIDNEPVLFLNDDDQPIVSNKKQKIEEKVDDDDDDNNNRRKSSRVR